LQQQEGRSSMLSALRGNKCLSAEAAEEFAEFAR
jgi:hypothetical protein